jgi:nonspecific dipeptidase
LKYVCFKVKLLQHRWRFPSLSIHGLEGAFSEPGCKTVIPRKVIGKFSIRIVPNQTPEKVEQVVVAYLNQQWKIRDSKNKMKVYVMLFYTSVLIIISSV